MKGDLILISRLTIEAETPICISAGNDHTISNAVIARDVNQLPYIPASTIKGVIYKELGIKSNPCLSFTDALMTNDYNYIKDGRKDENLFSFPKGKNRNNHLFYRRFMRLPIRHHVTTDSKGSSSFDIKGKNNEQIIYKGTRFVFEMELRYDKLSCNTEESLFDDIIRLLKYSPVRFGRGSRRGLGKIKLVKCLRAEVNMRIKEKREAYLNKSGKLDEEFSLFQDYTPPLINKGGTSSQWWIYRLYLRPRDFFIFGAATEEANINYHSAIEDYIIWEKTSGRFEKGYLIPASTIKGALLHRTRYHYCKIKGRSNIGKNEKLEDVDNAVGRLFGGKLTGNKSFNKGNVIFSDIIIPKEDVDDYIFNNIGIDRLTGTQFGRVLYSQEATRLKDSNPIIIEFYVKEIGLERDILKAFRESIQDICEERLPLGRGNNLGMGFFNGRSVIKNFADMNKKVNYQGYLWWNDKQQPYVYDNKPLNGEIDKILVDKDNGGRKRYVVEGLLWDQANSLSYTIRHIDGAHKIIKTEVTKEVEDLSEIQEYISNFKMPNHHINPILLFRQVWKEEIDEWCEGMKVLVPDKSVFVGFKKGKDEQSKTNQHE